ncbi:MAG: YdgA family protein [Burkholderiales bacterium]|nr:YdgA family protein [Burkholderiales bacterium]
MLKKMYQLKLKIIVIMLFSLVLLQLITAYFFGYTTERQMNAQFQRMTSSPFIEVRHRQYHRGIFSSDLTAEISLNSRVLSTVLNILPQNYNESLVSNINKNYSIRYTTHIEHGIFSGILNGYFVPTIAYARTSIIYPDQIVNVLNKFFNNQPPVVVDNIIYLDKSGRFKIHSPKFDYAEAVSGVKVIWGGLDAVIKYNDAFDRFKINLGVPNFELIAPTKGTIVIKNLTYKSEVGDSPNKIKVGNAILQLGLAKVEWKDHIKINFKIGDILHMLSGISSAEFLNGIDAIDPDNFLFTNVSYRSNSQDENNFFQASGTINIESIITNNKIYGPMNIDLSVSHVASAPFNQLIEKLIQVNAMNESSTLDQDKNRELLISTLKQYFIPILVESPVLKLNDFSLAMPDGLVTITGYATTAGFTPADMETQQKFMRKLVLDMHLSVPKPILSYMFVLQMRYLLSAGNAQMDKQSSEALTKVVNILLDNQINIWTKKGYLTNNNGQLGTHMHIESANIYFNDKSGDSFAAD